MKDGPFGVPFLSFFLGQASLGIENTMMFSWGHQQSGATGLIVSFSGGNPVDNIYRSMEIDFTCIPGGGIVRNVMIFTVKGFPTFITENMATLIYYFAWSSQYACPISTGTTALYDSGLKIVFIFW